MIFLGLSGNMIFIFPENMILFFRRKKKYGVFKIPFQKSGNMIFFVISGKMLFLFSRKYDISSLDGKWKMTFLKTYMEIWYFLSLYKCCKYDNTLLSKKAKIIFYRKNVIKGDISGITKYDDIHPRKYGIWKDYID